MGTGKPRIGTVARPAEKPALLELALAAAPVAEHVLVEGLVLVPVDGVSLEPTELVAVERKISGPVIGPVAELAQEISVPAIVLAVEQVLTAGERKLVQCRRIAALAQIVSVIALSHQAPGSVRVAMLLVAVGLTEALLDRLVIAEVPAWAEAHVLAEAHVVAVAGVEGRQTMD